MNDRAMAAAGLAVILLGTSGTSYADVLNMGGTRGAYGTWTGLASLEIVPVTNRGNAGELSGTAPGGGPQRVCGAVGYEYYIGKYEVTAGQYCEFLNATAATDTYGLYNTEMWSDSDGSKIQRIGSSGSYTYTVAPDWANRPVNWVSWADAARFANWLHNGQPTGVQDLTTTEDGSYLLDGATTNAELTAVTRKMSATWVIPTEDEWYKAAYHENDGPTDHYFDYPTSSNSTPSNDLLWPDGGNNANFFQNGLTLGTEHHRTPVGEFELSASPYNTYDQAGNVSELTETLVESGYGCRGGNFQYYHWVLHANYRGYMLATSEQDWLGFRVALVPEPATVFMLALGGMAMLRRGK